MNFKRKVFRTIYFYLMTAGLPVLLIHLAMENERFSAIVYAAAIALSLPLSFLPGKIIKKKVPLRVPVAVVFALAILLGMIVHASNVGLFFLRGAFSGLIMALMMLFSLREACLEYPQWTGQHGASIGLILYLIGGIATMSLIEAPLLKELFWIEALVFLAFTAFFLNNDNMLTGLATRKNARPPRSLITGNRVLTIVFACIAALIIFWSKLQAAAGQFGLWITKVILLLIHWIANLAGNNGSTGGGSEQANPAEMFSEFGETEPSTFWLVMEKVLVVVAIIVGLLLVLLALRTILRLLIKAYRYLREYMARFAEASGEDYVDEQTDLFDLDDIREQTKERLKKAVRRFTTRQKKWDEMDMRERVRYCIRQLYSKSGYSGGELRSLTIREAVPKLPKTDLSNEQLASLYEKARYSDESPTEQETAILRKAVKS